MFTKNFKFLACLEIKDFGEVVIVIVIVIVTGGKQSQLLVFWTWLGLEFDNKPKCFIVQLENLKLLF